MIKSHSDDPDVADAARQALNIITSVLAGLPKAETYDYGGQTLQLNDYNVCTICTTAIAEAQAAERALRASAERLDDETVKEHLVLAADLYKVEAEAAVIRAQLHNGHGTEPILNLLLGHAYERHIDETYQHSHHGGNG